MEKDETIVWAMKAKKSFKRKVSRVAGAVDRNASQFIRDAINEKIEQLAKRNPKVAQIVNEEQAA